MSDYTAAAKLDGAIRERDRDEIQLKNAEQTIAMLLRLLHRVVSFRWVVDDPRDEEMAMKLCDEIREVLG